MSIIVFLISVHSPSMKGLVSYYCSCGLIYQTMDFVFLLKGKKLNTLQLVKNSRNWSVFKCSAKQNILNSKC